LFRVSPGDVITFRLLRGGTMQEVAVRTGERSGKRR
jgi:hypothetical protein